MTFPTKKVAKYRLNILKFALMTFYLFIYVFAFQFLGGGAGPLPTPLDTHLSYAICPDKYSLQLPVIANENGVT